MTKMLSTRRSRSRRALLVGVDIFREDNLFPLEDSLAELRRLADTAGFEIVGQVTQKLDHPNPKTFVGAGKTKEIHALAEDLDVNAILFDDELSPRHQRELEEIIGEDTRVLDRTALILDIFAQHAHTKEGSLQVELAQYEYRLPRLTRAWTHLVRQAGGGGGRTGGTAGVGLRGPGETQLETDRRAIRRRISHLKDELEKVRAHRKRHRSRRKASRIPVISLVGYTNAGKSTLLNRLAESDVYTANKLFATLDPTTRRVVLPDASSVLFTDTVGFIQKLPTTLVAAFQATLEEIADADILLHVIDITHPQVKAQVESVHQTLEEINADHIPLIPVLNKIDRLKDPEAAFDSLENYPNAVAVSALRGYGIADLLDTVQSCLYEDYQPIIVELPHSEGALKSLFHEEGLVECIENKFHGAIIQGRIPVRHVAKYQPFVISNYNSEQSET